MLASNDEIYYIFRKDLHLSEEKTRALLLNMDIAIGETLAKNFIAPTNVSKSYLKLDKVAHSQHSIKEEVEELKEEVNQLKKEIERFMGTVCTRTGYFIVGTVGILIILNIVLNIVIVTYKK